jgi:DAACS family dicarboxylate/amino acid:cation (Na+ or H+) symporter/aerobic C4-dicarboxylate transport protein
MLDMFLQGMFGVVRIVMYVAPIGAFGGMAFTIAKYGIGTLASFGQLMLCPLSHFHLCSRSVVGMVLPTGYTFNADGTAIYLVSDPRKDCNRANQAND